MMRALVVALILVELVGLGSFGAAPGKHETGP